MTAVWLTVVFPAARPLSCGIRPCSFAFGAGQFDRPENPKNAKILQRYINWYYASVGISVMVSVTVIVYSNYEGLDCRNWNSCWFNVVISCHVFLGLLSLCKSESK
ncbi:NRT1/ PTR family 1.1-like protein [Tanacetum coccineum]